MIFLILQVLATAYTVLVVPESPKWLYTWKNFNESREILVKVGKFNAVDTAAQQKLERTKFIDEDVSGEKESEGNNSIATSLS